MSAPFRAVIDASVAVKLFVPEALSAQAHAVFSRLHETPPAQLVVPGLFFVECANVFWKWTRRFDHPTEQAGRHLDVLLRLDLHVVPTQALCARALSLSLKRGLSAYDALYAAAATEIGAPLITADERLVKQLEEAPLTVQWLGDFSA